MECKKNKVHKIKKLIKRDSKENNNKKKSGCVEGG
jgi:hypothetical protein